MEQFRRGELVFDSVEDVALVIAFAAASERDLRRADHPPRQRIQRLTSIPQAGSFTRRCRFSASDVGGLV